MSNRTNTEYDGLHVTSLPMTLLSTFLVYVCPPGCCRDPVHTQPRELQASGGLSGQDGDGDQHEALRHRDHQLPEDGVQTGGPRQLYLLGGAEEESPQSQPYCAVHEGAGAGDGDGDQEAGEEPPAGGGAPSHC